MVQERRMIGGDEFEKLSILCARGGGLPAKLHVDRFPVVACQRCFCSSGMLAGLNTGLSMGKEGVIRHILGVRWGEVGL